MYRQSEKKTNLKVYERTRRRLESAVSMTPYFKKIRRQVDEELNRIFDSRRGIPQTLLESMRYSIFAGGKRLRSVLVVASAEAVGGERATALPTSAAFEIIHTYTLIHDDLPIMDNDDLRRGLATNHKKFGQATALLAGDALLTLAFEVMAEPPPRNAAISPSVQLEVLRKAAKAVGAQGTVGGQEMDIEHEGRTGVGIEVLEKIHRLKTGAMIASAVECGGLLGGASGAKQSALLEYGAKVGLAFQVIDDILDVSGETGKLGKNVGMDIAKNKMTYPAVVGLDESGKLAEELIIGAIDALKPLGKNGAPLEELARFVMGRTH